MKKIAISYFALVTQAALAAPAPPALDVVLAPHAAPGQPAVVDRLDVTLHIAAPGVAAGKALLRMPLTIVSTPTAAYPAAAIHASDAAGPLPLVAVDEAPTPTATYRRYETARATKGDVVVRYATPPRAVDAQTRNGPLFDLRAQPGGIMGAGVYFLALPQNEGGAPYKLSLKWDLAAMPAGARGVWSGGEGTQTRVAPSEVLAFSFYAAGAIKSEPATGKNDFGLYWLAPPPFEIAPLAAGLRTLYGSMAAFFHDTGAPYRIFIRANPYPAGGGTALAKSFMFGYGVNGETASTDLQMLLAHEMTHNWPRLTDDDHAATAWYTEGMAEYYSAILTLRAGVIDQPKFLDVINDRATGYATNPFRDLSNAAVGAKFWSDARAQRVPYGRGFMYLARVDAQLRAATKNAYSLEDVVLEILARQKRGEKGGIAEWLALITAKLGDSARTEYQAMVDGQPQVPLATGFAPCYRPVQVQVRPFDLGFDEMRLGQATSVRSESTAYAAGVREGDKIVALTSMQDVKADPALVMHMTVQRGAGQVKIDYLPRAAPVPAWQWERVPGVPDTACKL
jgi:hypothetical protein